MVEIPKVQFVDRIQEQSVEITEEDPQACATAHRGTNWGRASASDPGANCESCHSDSTGTLFPIFKF